MRATNDVCYIGQRKLSEITEIRLSMNAWIENGEYMKNSRTWKRRACPPPAIAF